MSDTAATRKQLKIKAGVVKRSVLTPIILPPTCRKKCQHLFVLRYQKELALYRAEVLENGKKLESLTATKGESWDVKNAVCVILSLSPFFLLIVLNVSHPNY
jgi:Tubulin binding cofactor A